MSVSNRSGFATRPLSKLGEITQERPRGFQGWNKDGLSIDKHNKGDQEELDVGYKVLKQASVREGDNRMAGPGDLRDTRA